ncbi:MAG: hypothetical protein NC548_64190, partial [Lachnospiraceae bacterium]|nr:hypothetical protein [Lachnospiraceae bacterium]
IRSLLSYPHRQDAYIQPWRVPEAPENDLVTLRYEIASKTETEEITLAMERPEKARILWNGEEIPHGGVSPADMGGEEYYVDSFIRKVKLPGIKKGKNELILEIPYGRKTNLENIYLLGEFGVEVRGTESCVTEKPERILFGDITRQGMPFYGGSLVYAMDFTLEKEGKISVRVPHFRSPVLAVRLDGKEMGLIAFAPHVLGLGCCGAGAHRLEICVYGNRFNTFGTLHNCNDEYQWYGPNSYRTEGCEWSEGYEIRPFGILSRVEILEG